MRTLIKDALASDSEKDSLLIEGWVRTRRDSKTFSFIEVNDGSCLKNIQVIIEASHPIYQDIQKITTGCSLSIKGKLVASQGKGQQWEVVAQEVTLLGEADPSYPLQKKGHTPEFLRTIAHLRPRSNLFGSVFRLRSRASYAIHQFFQERDFYYIHTPIITSSDCEGAGDLFRVTTLDPTQEHKNFENDFFHKPTYLTVSGQLAVENFACALSNVYTFGPTFRSENSNTARHASEFWMVEPEIAFCDLEGTMNLAEEFMQYVIKDVLHNCPEEIELFQKFIDKQLLERLQFVTERPFKRITYTEAITLLQNSGEKFAFPVEYGIDLQTEHERYLTETHFQCPVTVYNYPRDIKAFYMRVNDDRQTVAAMDVLVPRIGEIIGGSQREERLPLLKENIQRHDLDEKEYTWYLDLRRYGTVPHSGFGLGLERLIMFITGMANIRDVIPFARTPGTADF